MKWLVALVVLAAAAAGVGWILTAPKMLDAATLAAVSAPGDARNGELIFHVGGCVSCHIGPGKDDPTKLGGGVELKTPFGSFFPPNISPDRKDGIGQWTAAQFADAVLAGVSPDGAHYFPAFPYPSYRAITPTDVRDLFAYLKTLPPVAGRSPNNTLPFPFNVRRAVGVWKFLNFQMGPLPEVAGKSASWLRGRYLVEGPGHCAECHSPRDMMGGIVTSKRLQGGPAPDGKGKVPDITAAGRKDWKVDDVTSLFTPLTLGIKPDGDAIGGPMKEVVGNLAHLSDADRTAIGEYLKSVGAKP